MSGRRGGPPGSRGGPWPRGRCSVCRRDVAVNESGTGAVWHNRPGRAFPPCEGKGKPVDPYPPAPPRPDTVTTALAALADWLDGADQLIDRLAKARNIPRPNSGDDVQRDLRHLADWFTAHPEAAAQAWAYVRAHP